jgi:hypothetical protein
MERCEKTKPIFVGTEFVGRMQILRLNEGKKNGVAAGRTAAKNEAAKPHPAAIRPPAFRGNTQPNGLKVPEPAPGGYVRLPGIRFHRGKTLSGRKEMMSGNETVRTRFLVED